MCWSTEKFLNKIPRIALKDIHVKKVMHFNPNTGKFISFYTEHEYESGVANKRVKIKPFRRRFFGYNAFVIERGYHSYSNKCKFEGQVENKTYIYVYAKNHPEVMLDKYWDMGGGSYYYPICYPIWKPICLVDCTIPKGTIYHENENGEIVSQRIIINGKEEINKD